MIFLREMLVPLCQIFCVEEIRVIFLKDPFYWKVAKVARGMDCRIVHKDKSFDSERWKHS